jgi:hypothetical protein
MKKHLLLSIMMLVSIQIQAQFFKSIYDEIFKYGTLYVAGDVENSTQPLYPEYFVRTNPDNLYDVPKVIDQTVYHPYDYRYSFGIRRLARFDYEIKSKNYYDGTENNKALSSPTAAVKGFEYLIHFEKERERGREFTNSRLFLRHTGKYHIAKIEQREEGNVDFEYTSGEIRLRLPIGKKFSISAGGIYRTHVKAYGYNPIEIWLNEQDEDGNAKNPWWSLGYQYGYQDAPYTSTVYNPDGSTQEIFNYLWTNSRGDIVAYTDEDFRDTVFGGLMNKFNKEKWSELDPFAEIAPIVGFDFYHYTPNFWMHLYGNWILPHHEYVSGNVDFSYLHRESWGKGGYNNLLGGKQWEDYQAGLMLGVKLSKRFGIFIEGEYVRFWDSEIYNSSVGINFRL